MKPAFQGQEDPRIAGIDDAANLVILELRTMSRAASKDLPRHRQELRQLLSTDARRWPMRSAN
jgi:hypothetical protein